MIRSLMPGELGCHGDAVEFTGGVARLKLEPLHMIMLGLANR